MALELDKMTRLPGDEAFRRAEIKARSGRRLMPAHSRSCGANTRVI